VGWGRGQRNIYTVSKCKNDKIKKESKKKIKGGIHTFLTGVSSYSYRSVLKMDHSKASVAPAPTLSHITLPSACTHLPSQPFCHELNHHEALIRASPKPALCSESPEV
jgi:hypothetical protein